MNAQYWLRWSLVNLLTCGRGFAVVTILALVDMGYDSTIVRLLVFFTFTAGAFTDLYDGKLARHWKVESTAGEILDPFLDKTLCWAVLLYIIWPQCEDVPAALFLLAIGYAAVAVYDVGTLVLRIAKSFGAKLNMKTSNLGKQRTVIFLVTLGTALAYEVVQPWLPNSVQHFVHLLFFGAALLVLGYTYKSAEFYLKTVRPWELFWSPSSATRA